MKTKTQLKNAELTVSCPRCKSDKVKLFPNCDYTFGCSNCGKAFSIIKKEKKK